MSEFTKGELDRLRLLIRHATRSTAIPLKRGEDEELIAARQEMPEPTRHDYPFYSVRLSPPHPIGFRMATEIPVIELIRDAAFHRVLVQSNEGTTFWVWQNTKDGCHYL